jgi:hypothetical protein
MKFSQGCIVIKAILFSLAMLVGVNQTASAKVKVEVSRVAPAKSDPGNEITQDDVKIDFSHPFYQSENKMTSLEGGLSLKSTTLKFDAPQIGDVHLMKLEAPVSGTTIRSAQTVFNWTLSPGMHGETNDFSGAEFRVQGQGLFILPRGSKQWLLGLAYGEHFGKPQVVPVVGAIWQLSEKSQLTTLFPLLKYEYTAETKTKYNVSAQPVGAQWTWQKGAVGNTEAGNIELSGIQFSGGASAALTKHFTGFFSLGLVTNRKIKISRQSNASINGSLDLKDAWLAQAGLEFP